MDRYMQKASFLKILLLLVIPLSAKELNDSIINAFLDNMYPQFYLNGWGFYPLTKFPYLKGEHYPWTLACEGHYKSYKAESNVVCVNNETIIVGSKAYFQDSLYLYRAEKFSYTRCFWLFQEEYIIIVNQYGIIMNMLTRKDLKSNLVEVPFLYP